MLGIVDLRLLDISDLKKKRKKKKSPNYICFNVAWNLEFGFLALVVVKE